MKQALLNSSSLDQGIHIEVERAPVRVFISGEELTEATEGLAENLTWDVLKGLLKLKGVPAERLEGRPDYKADLTEQGLLVEFP